MNNSQRIGSLWVCKCPQCILHSTEYRGKTYPGIGRSKKSHHTHLGQIHFPTHQVSYNSHFSSPFGSTLNILLPLPVPYQDPQPPLPQPTPPAIPLPSASPASPTQPVPPDVSQTKICFTNSAHPQPTTWISTRLTDYFIFQYSTLLSSKPSTHTLPNLKSTLGLPPHLSWTMSILWILAAWKYPPFSSTNPAQSLLPFKLPMTALRTMSVIMLARKTSNWKDRKSK